MDKKEALIDYENKMRAAAAERRNTINQAKATYETKRREAKKTYRESIHA